MTRIGFTATRKGMTAEQKSALGNPWRLHRRGLGIVHPPTNYSERAWREVPRHTMRPERPYLDRNRDVVRETASLIAAPAEPEEQLRSGTW
jgi:tRNA(Ile)-lysidine synthase TilS/MesJ